MIWFNFLILLLLLGVAVTVQGKLCHQNVVSWHWFWESGDISSQSSMSTGKTCAIEILLLLETVEVCRFEWCVHALPSSSDVHNAILALPGYVDLFWKGWIRSLDIVLIFIIGNSERNQMSLSGINMAICMSHGMNMAISVTPGLFLKWSLIWLLLLSVSILNSLYPKEGFLSFSPQVLHLAICKTNLEILLFRFIHFLQVWA